MLFFRTLEIHFLKKNDKDISKIVAQFYRNLADLIVELIKSQKLSDEELIKRVQINEIKIFDNYMINQRQKYKGTLMIDYKKTFRILAGLRNELLAVFMFADQSPAKTEINYWTKFLGRETPFYTGMEKIAQALNFTVIYLDIQRLKRGYYAVDVQMITDQASKTDNFEITNQYIQHLEKSIINHPDNWLWSHRRWKFSKEEIAS